MAGVLKVDTLQSDSNLALKIATANVAFIDSNGLNVVGGNLTIGATQFAEGGQIQTSGIADDAITSDKILSVANTKISGLIQAAQIGSANASVINAGTLAGARLPAGSVLQVVEAISSTVNKVTTSTSYVTATTNASITPSSASNKIFIQWSGECDFLATGLIFVTVYRGATDLGIGNGGSECFARMHDVSAGRFLANQNFFLIDSPNTTSSVTYTIYFKCEGGTEVRIRDDLQPSRIVLMEIAA
jgi:hypothetical protein